MLSADAARLAALGELESMQAQEPMVADRIATIVVRGPLEHHANPFCCSYESIKAQWAAACADPSVKAILLDVDSPGGLTSGCFSAVRDMRRAASAAGKPTVAFAHNANSAAYALVCACDKVYAAEDSMLGSIGVIHQVTDYTEADRKAGIQVTLITSGERKADGSPSKPVDDDVRQSLQSVVDSVAAIFFDLVEESRGIAAETVKGFQARQYPGRQAEALGLTDGTMTRDQCLALIASDEQPPGGITESNSMTAEEKKEMLAKLAKAAEDGDMTDEDKEAFAKALGVKAEDDKAEDDKEDDKAEDDSEDDKEDDKNESKAMATKLAALEAFVAGIQKRDAALALKAEQDELLSQRPDFTAEVCNTLRSGPIKVLRDAVKTFPRMSNRTSAARAALSVTPTAGGTGVSMLSAEESESLKARMGLVQTQLTVKDDGLVQYFGVRAPKETK